MLNSSQTLIGVLRQTVEVWRKRENWSRETVAMHIVETHIEAGFDQLTGIVFEPNTKDAYMRAKVNADRIFRWLDDSTKDTNLLPANFIPSMLLALPMDLRLAALATALRPLDVACRRLGVETGTTFSEQLAVVLKEGAEAQVATLALLDGATQVELATAQQEITQSIDASRVLLASVEAELAKGG